jgi:hypothetical protein
MSPRRFPNYIGLSDCAIHRAQVLPQMLLEMLTSLVIQTRKQTSMQRALCTWNPPHAVPLSHGCCAGKIGGLDRFSSYVAPAVGLLFLLAYPLCGAVGYLPTLVVASICVFVGCGLPRVSLSSGALDCPALPAPRDLPPSSASCASCHMLPARPNP